MVPKESFVRVAPWNWIIGTGIYLDDVQDEINRLTGRLVHFCIGISGAITLLLAYLARENLRIERHRGRAEAEPRESHEKYAALVEAATEGTLMVLDGRCAYATARCFGCWATARPSCRAAGDRRHPAGG